MSIVKDTIAITAITLVAGLALGVSPVRLLLEKEARRNEK